MFWRQRLLSHYYYYLLFPLHYPPLIVCSNFFFTIFRTMCGRHRPPQHTRRIFVSTVKMEFMLWWLMRPEKRTLSSILISFALLNIGLGGKSTVNNNKRKHNLAIRKTFRTQCCNLLAGSLSFSLSSGPTGRRNIFGTKVQREEGKKLQNISTRDKLKHEPSATLSMPRNSKRERNDRKEQQRAKRHRKKSNYFRWR